MLYKQILLTNILLLSFSTSTLAKSPTMKQKTVQAYQQKCLNKSRLPLHSSQKICRCMSQKLLKKITLNDMNQLILGRKRPTQEQAQRVDALYNNISQLENFELDIASLCLKKYKKQ